MLLEDGVVVDEWCSLVNPCQRIPAAIQRFTGITDEMVADAPTFEELHAEVRSRLEGRLFVAHNARFDYGFLRSEFRRLGEKILGAGPLHGAPVEVAVCRAQSPQSRRADRAMGPSSADSAIARSVTPPCCRPCLRHSRAPSGPGSCSRRSRRLASRSRLPPQLPADLADDLPDGPGVYLFRGERGVLLYVGKSRNIRSRVLAHFAGSHRSGKDAKLAQQVRDVEWIETGGELGALLVESRLVKELAPEANRRLRKPTGVHCIRLRDLEGRLQPCVEPFGLDDLDSDAESYGPFRTQRDALSERSRARPGRPDCA